jgi:hypothetical protein
LKYLYNPATDSFEALEPTMRDRFALGSKDPTPEVKTDGEVAGALMDAFPNSSFLQYQNALDEGFQGSFEDFLQINSLDKSELDMQAIEGQTAGTSLVKALLKIPDEATSLIKQKSEVKAFPSFSKLKERRPENYTESEKIFEKELTKKFKAIADDPLYKDVIPKNFKNIKSITELSQSEFNKIKLNLEDFQYKSITDEKGIGPYNTLSERLQDQVKGLFKARKKASERPDFFTKKIAGDTFNLPYMKRVDPGTFKNFENLYPKLKKIEANPTVENYYNQLKKGTKGEQVLINDIQAYLTGVDTRTANNVFNSPIKMNLFKALDLENKLSEETINLIKKQKGEKAAREFSKEFILPKAVKKSTELKLQKVNTESIKRINDIYSFDTDVTSREVIDQYYGDSYLKAKPKEKVQMLKDLRNDIVTYYKIAADARPKPKGVRLPSKEKVDDILTTIMEGKGQDSFDIMGGYLRDIYSNIAESITKPGFDYDTKIRTISKNFSNQHVDHTVGLTPVYEAAPGYVEAIQVIPKSVNLNKGRLLEKASSGIIDDFFTNTLNKPRRIGGQEYKTFEEKVNAFNTLSKNYGNVNNIDTPLLRFGEPGQGPSPKETVKYFSEFSKGAQDNMMEVWNNHGFVIYTNSRPMGSPFWTKTKPMKNMGGLIDRVNFSEGTKIDQFTETIEKGPDPFVDQALASLNSSNVAKQFIKDNTPSLEKQIYGTDGERSLMQTFNTMFLDPRAYPYYAQEVSSGLANVPEFIARSVPTLTYLTTNLSKLGPDVLEKTIDLITPKYTQAAKEKIGFTDMLEESREKRTGAQRTTGGILELAGELPGPATPLFLFKLYPKLAKQIQNLTGGTAAVEKINKEIENKMATQGVNQTRRDIILATGAGGAVALLKYLGLDFLTKAPKVAKAAPEIVTKGGTPKYFFDFVNLIKTKGDDITEKAATVERQKVYDYNGYTMYEDISTGKISIRKDTEGGATYSIGDGEYETVDGIIRKEEINYEPSETILNEKGKPVKVPDQYDEATVRPDEDGGEGDFEAGLDSIDDILDLLSKDGKTYSKDELIEMGIRPDVLTESSLKTKKAGGGIIKLAGDDSGPPPKSGPTPHGLPYVAKNVRPIKERK